jgi:glycosyltransferase involved in cell wall biosynthesis
MQAMAVGLPIVTTPVGAIPEIIDDGRTGLIVTPRQPSELAAGLRRLMDDGALARRLGDAARQEALARFGTDAMLDRMEKVFADAIARAKR